MIDDRHFYEENKKTPKDVAVNIISTIIVIVIAIGVANAFFGFI